MVQASPDGTINCVEQAYDFASERFLVSLLKHEAQHTVDMKRFSKIPRRAGILGKAGGDSLLQRFESAAKALIRSG